MAVGTCSNCGSKRLSESAKPVSSGGGYAPNFLPGLGSFWTSARFTIVVCGECGLTSLFALPESLARLEDSDKWQRLI